MKKLLLIVLPLLLIVGCSSPEPINYETTLIKRDGVYYTKDTNKPYSGPVFSLDDKGRNKGEGNLENGKMISYKELQWYENGQKITEATYKDGKLDGLFTIWHENGQKMLEGTFKDGYGALHEFYENGKMKTQKSYDHVEKDGLWTRWYENGQKESEGTYKDGRYDGLWTYWYDNGQKESEGTFKDGWYDGLWTYWYDNGQKSTETTWKGMSKISRKEWNEDGSLKE